jgi:hypothetical protein
MSDLSASPRKVRDDTMHYGVEFRCVNGVIEWRHNLPDQPEGAWQPMTRVVRGKIVCELGWTSSRLRIWADLLEAYEREWQATYV